MDIVMASDECYAPHLAALVVSVCENNKGEKLDFHILNGGISVDSFNKILDIKNKYNKVEFYSYTMSDDIILKKLGLSEIYKDRSLTTYARLFIPEILSTNIETALYIDVDVIVLGKLRPLFDNPPELIAGVKDIINIDSRVKVGLSENDNYVCAGVIMWNLKKCRELELTDVFRNFVQERNGNVECMDQGTINGAMKGKVELIHPKYDVLTTFFFNKSDELRDMGSWDVYYSQSEIDEAVRNPVIVHFTPALSTRPWAKGCKHPLKNEYVKYRNMTKFSPLELLPDNRKLYLKILGVLNYNLPYSIYKKIHAVLYKVFR